jgi:hypothetical protein
MQSVNISNNYGEITLKVQCCQRSWHTPNTYSFTVCVLENVRTVRACETYAATLNQVASFHIAV